MLSCQSFRQVLAVNVLSVMTILLVGLPTHAYRLQCKWVMDPSIQNLVTDQTPQRIERAFQAYAKLMNLEGLGIKDGHFIIGHKRGPLDQVKARLQRMNAQEKAQLKQIVRAIYNEVKAFKYEKLDQNESHNQSNHNNQKNEFSRTPIKSFKRHLDLILSVETNAHAFFKQKMTVEWKSLEETLNDYYILMQEWTGSPLIQEGKEVLMTSLRLQDRFLRSGSKYEKETLILFGSFVNGRAYLEKSDLDFAVFNSGFETQIRENQNLTNEIPEFQFSSTEPHVIQANTIHQYGYLNPLIVLIKKDHIVVRVYKNRLSTEENSKPGFFDDYYF